MKKLATLLALLYAAAFAQQKGTFNDPRDGKVYKTVTIGEQIWMAENLNYNAGGSRCYNNDARNCDKYGRLYTYFQANGDIYANIDGVCPSGWSLPQPAEWNTLVATTKASYKAGDILKAKSGWDSNGGGKDTYGFAALPGGIFGPNDDGEYKYKLAGQFGHWWSKTPDNSDNPIIIMSFATDAVVSGHMVDQNAAISIRCVKYVIDQKNVVVQKGAFTDSRDGKTYETVKIGAKTWMAENLNYDTKGSKCYGNDPANCKKYGRLYDWASALNVDKRYNDEGLKNEKEMTQGICPSGWKIPDPGEVKLLLEEIGTVTVSPTAIGGESIRSFTAGVHLRSKSGWKSNKGKDTYGFAALPGGAYTEIEFIGIGEAAVWWVLGQWNASTGSKMVIINDDETVVFGPDYKSSLFSVRCVKD